MTSKRKSEDEILDRVDALIQEILVDAYGEDEQFWGFLQAFEDNVTLPANAFVIGEPVTVTGFYYDGNERRGLTTECNKGSKRYEVALSELVFPSGSEGAEYVEAYRAWLGLKPAIIQEVAPEKGKRYRATAEDFDLTRTVKLIVLRVKERAARCRVPGTEREVTLRSSGIWQIVPGEIITVRPGKHWRYAGQPNLSGEVESRMIDVPGLGLRPLRLYDRGTWDPADEYWGEEDGPVSEWARPIISHGPRPAFEMEQVIPGADLSESDDPIIRSNELKAAGSIVEAGELLLELLAADLRCLDAHAHLGNLVYDRQPEEGLRHFEIGMRIGELSLGESFEGTLNWGWIDNRPYLRCLHGYGLCLWRLKRLAEAERIFRRMLWLNPSDNQGARFLLED